MKPYVTTKSLRTKTKKWLDEIRHHNRHDLKLNRKKAALLVIDMQEFFLDPKSPTFTCGGLAILPNVKRLIESFRKAKRPVIFTLVLGASWGSTLGTTRVRGRGAGLPRGLGSSR